MKAFARICFDNFGEGKTEREALEKLYGVEMHIMKIQKIENLHSLKELEKGDKMNKNKKCKVKEGRRKIVYGLNYN